MLESRPAAGSLLTVNRSTTVRHGHLAVAPAIQKDLFEMDGNGDNFLRAWAWSNLQNEAYSESTLQFSSVDHVINGKVDLIEAFCNTSLEFHEKRRVSYPCAEETSAPGGAPVPWICPEIQKVEKITSCRGSPFSSLQKQVKPSEEEGSGILTEVIFSSIDNAPTNSYSRSTSSGESADHGFNACHRQGDQRPQNSSRLQQDELGSQGSSNPAPIRQGSSRARAPLKRKCREREPRIKNYLPYGDIPQYNSSTTDSSFRIFFESSSRPSKKPRCHPDVESCEPDMEAIAQVKEMIYRAAALRPVSFGTAETAEKPRRRNVRISSDPQTVAARHRRERISERLRVLQRLVPGGGKLDTASMLDEAANYLRFLKSQVTALQALGPPGNTWTDTSVASSLLPHSDLFPLFHTPKSPLQTQTLNQSQTPDVEALAPASAPLS